ncbi:MAG: 30S ribosomal protein S8 [Planctomycetes bacterium]|nr:30S ribosomal protein S8 [Planctomycetota bacterium]
MWSDPIADMLTRIRNGVTARKKQVVIPASKLKTGLARVLKDEGYILGYDVVEDTRQGILRVDLKYGPNGEVVIHKIKRMSKPGCRRYSKAQEIPRVLNGLGIAILSTNRGVMSDRSCREGNIGGELLCTVC